MTPLITSAAPRPRVGVLGPTPAVARRLVVRLRARLPGSRLVPLSLARYLSDRRAPSRVVLCPAGSDPARDAAFLKEVRTRVLWSPPGVDLWSAIAGLLGSHEAPPPGAPTPAAGRRRTSALLLEGDVTPAIARRADAAGAPRHWVVERVQRVRIPRSGLESLARRGVRWSVLQPVEVVGIALSPELASARQRWKRLLPPDVPVWVFPK